MKTVEIPDQAKEVNALLELARQEDILLRSADGSEFMLTAVDDFDHEIAATRRNEKLMALLDARSKDPVRFSLDEVRRQLGFP